jgi:hypothetical protein
MIQLSKPPKNKPGIYNTDLTAGSLKLSESRIVADLLLRNVGAEEWKQAIYSENVLQSKTPETSRRLANLIRRRLQTMEQPLWKLFRDGKGHVAMHAALAAAVKHSQLFGDFRQFVVEKTPGPSPSFFMRLKENLFLQMEIPRPLIFEQKTIVDWIEAVAKRVEEANYEAESVIKRLGNLLMSAFYDLSEGAPRRFLKDVTPLVRRQEVIDPAADYLELGIRCFGKGTFQKPSLSGLEVGTKKLYSTEPGDLVFSNVFAWEGAIAVVKDEDKERFGSHPFITCVPNSGIATAVFLSFCFQTLEGIEQIRDASPGGAGRNHTLGLNKLEKIMVPVPRYELQLWFDQLSEKVEAAKRTMIQTVEERNAPFPSVLNQVFSGEDSVA